MAEDVALRLRRLRFAFPDFRFGIAFGGIALLVVCAIGVAAWRVSHLAPKPDTAAAWSSWRPRSTGFKGVQEIAEHIAGPKATAIAFPVAFRVGTGSTPGRIRAVVVHERSGALRIDSRSTAGFSLCGLGQDCALRFDSAEQRLLLRREGLELALYTFAYLGFDRVVVLLAPRPGDDHPLSALLFRRADLAPSLGRPLRDTLNVRRPTESDLDGAIGRALDRMTAPYLYAVEHVAAPDDDAPVLTLSPLEDR